ncbi:uncharacterized protein LOC134181787 [Corticium candelabrum]|uniref:uncharacterized protein LOC134181787 n=1 Tax=Corticium candelabrum TaxID=121492 RepID=UPI002E253FE7|nr:uncharacterized protein LOC134181787 [Corticium candelabrum]
MATLSNSPFPYRERFHVLVLCSLYSEVEAARRVLEYESESAFVDAHTEVITGLCVCRNWNDSGLTIALIGQSDVGGKKCASRLIHLTRLFRVDVAVMTGVCSGIERYRGAVEYGTVVVAKSTSTEGEGLKRSDGKYEARGDPEKMNEDVGVVIEQAIARLGERSDWLATIPRSERLASPRYVEEMMLDEVMKSSDGVSKTDLFDKLESEEIMKNWSRKMLDSILEQMVKTRGWVSVERGVVRCTASGEERENSAFPCADKIRVVIGGIGSISYETVNLPNDIEQYKKRMANSQLKGIDMEAYTFMSHCKEVFPGCVCLVMKGIKNDGTANRHEYYHQFAASTPVAFLRYLLGLTPFRHL